MSGEPITTLSDEDLDAFATVLVDTTETLRDELIEKIATLDEQLNLSCAETEAAVTSMLKAELFK